MCTLPRVFFFITATKADEPVVDPLALKQVDLRVYQKTLVEGDTSAVVVSGAWVADVARENVHSSFCEGGDVLNVLRAPRF